jgi:hypothetical protein
VKSTIAHYLQVTIIIIFQTIATKRKFSSKSMEPVAIATNSKTIEKQLNHVVLKTKESSEKPAARDKRQRIRFAVYKRETNPAPPQIPLSLAANPNSKFKSS